MVAIDSRTDAEALAKGTAAAMEGIRIILGLPQATSPEKVAAEYRKHLFLRGAVGSKNHPPAFDLAKAHRGTSAASCSQFAVLRSTGARESTDRTATHFAH
jgi:hypothetical protein